MKQKLSMVEFRVVWKRADCRRKVRRFAHESRAVRWLGLLTSDEPWRFYNPPKDPDRFECCDGYQCGCRGETVRVAAARMKEELPTLEYAHIEARAIGKWAVAP